MATDVTHDNSTTSHEKGQLATVKDGHLHVWSSKYSNEAEIVAIYAPGHWQRVVVND